MKNKQFYTRKELINECDISRDTLREVRDVLTMNTKSSDALSYTIGDKNAGRYSMDYYDILKYYRYIEGYKVSKELDLEDYTTYFCLNTVPQHTKFDTEVIRKIIPYDLAKLKRTIPELNLVYTIDYSSGKIEGLANNLTYTYQSFCDKLSNSFSSKNVYLSYSNSQHEQALAFKLVINESELFLNDKNFLQLSDDVSLGMYFPKEIYRPDFLGNNGKVSAPQLMLLKWRESL